MPMGEGGGNVHRNRKGVKCSWESEDCKMSLAEGGGKISMGEEGRNVHCRGRGAKRSW